MWSLTWKMCQDRRAIGVWSIITLKWLCGCGRCLGFSVWSTGEDEYSIDNLSLSVSPQIQKEREKEITDDEAEEEEEEKKEVLHVSRLHSLIYM